MSELDIASMEEDSKSVADADSLATITKLAEKQLQLQAETAEMEAALKAKKAELRRVASVDIPEAMAAVNMEMFKLKTGQTVSIVQHVAVNIKAADKPKAFNWMGEHGFGALVKTSMKLEFGKGEEERAREVADLLERQGFDVATKQDVHAQTLKKFGRDMLEEGREDIPDYIRIDSFPEAVIK